MPLTAQEVRAKQFKTVRMREGYDLDEVDKFLDEVELEIGRLTEENDQLRGELASRPVDADAPVVAPVPSAFVAPIDTEELDRLAAENDKLRSELQAAQGEFDRARAEAEEARAAAAAAVSAEGPSNAALATLAAPAPLATVSAATTESPSAAALKLLELATRTADDHVEAAKAEADEMVTAAKAQADAATAQKIIALNAVAEADGIRSGLEQKIEDLRAFEKEYRQRLRAYLEGQLREVDSRGDGAGTAAAIATAATTAVSGTSPVGALESASQPEIESAPAEAVTNLNKPDVTPPTPFGQSASPSPFTRPASPFTADNESPDGPLSRD